MKTSEAERKASIHEHAGCDASFHELVQSRRGSKQVIRAAKRALTGLGLLTEQYFSLHCHLNQA